MSIKASVYIICKNEEKHIKRVLESIKEFDEIIVVDSGSTDKTLEIVKEYTDKIFYQEWLGFSAQKEFAKNLCKNEWVLNLDADEELTNELKKEIEEVIKDDNVDGLDIPISAKHNYDIKTKFLKYNRRVRFFRRSRGFYNKKLVHESIQVDGKIKKTKSFIFDYGTENIEKKIDKINNYSTLAVKEKSSKDKKYSILKLLFIFTL
ncbi:MAG: glycosyltransferase family 2 protein, partial [Campylobacteraceae bacterium]